MVPPRRGRELSLDGERLVVRREVIDEQREQRERGLDGAGRERERAREVRARELVVVGVDGLLPEADQLRCRELDGVVWAVVDVDRRSSRSVIAALREHGRAGRMRFVERLSIELALDPRPRVVVERFERHVASVHVEGSIANADHARLVRIQRHLEVFGELVDEEALEARLLRVATCGVLRLEREPGGVRRADQLDEVARRGRLAAPGEDVVEVEMASAAPVVLRHERGFIASRGPACRGW